MQPVEMRTVVLVLRTAASLDLGDIGAMVRDAESVDMRISRDTSVHINGETIELRPEPATKLIGSSKSSKPGKKLHPAEKSSHDGKLVMEVVKNALGQPVKRINVTATLRNLGMTIDQMKVEKATFGSLLHRVRASYAAQVRKQKAKRGEK